MLNLLGWRRKQIYDHSPAVPKVKVQAHFQQCLVVFDGFGDGHLNLVAQKLSLLVGGLDLFHTLLNIGSLETKIIQVLKLEKEKQTGLTYLSSKPLFKKHATLYRSYSIF